MLGIAYGCEKIAHFRHRCAIATAGLVLLLSFFLRIYRLAVLPLWFDEGFSAYVARLDLSEGLAYLIQWDAHPPLSYWLLHFWMRAAGDTEFALRFPSVFAGVVSVALLFALGRSVGGQSLGLATATLASINPLLIYHAQQVRMYALVTMLVLLGTILLFRAFQRPHVRRYWITYGAAMVLALYTHYLAGFILLFHLLLVVVLMVSGSGKKLAAHSGTDVGGEASGTQRFRRDGLASPGFLYGFTIAMVALVAAYLPWVPAIIAQAGLSGPGAWRGYVPPLQMLVESLAVLVIGDATGVLTTPILWLSVSSGLLLALLGLIPGAGSSATESGRQRISVQAVFGWSYLLVPLISLVVFSSVRPLYHWRYLVVFCPPMLMLISWGALRLARTSWLLTGVSTMVLGAGLAFGLLTLFADSPTWLHDDFRSAAQALDSSYRPGDTLVVSSGATYPALSYYLERPVSWRGHLAEYDPDVVAFARQRQPEGLVVVQVGTIAEDPRGPLSTPEDQPITLAEAQRQLGMIAASSQRVWLFKNYSTITDPDSVVVQALSKYAVAADERWFPGVSYPQVHLYLPRLTAADLDTLAHRLDAAWPVGGLLQGYRIDPEHPAPGQSLSVTLYWQAGLPVPPGYHLYVHLMDRHERLITQHDGPPLGGRWPESTNRPDDLLPDEYELSLPIDLMPGTYSLRVGIYELSSLVEVNLVDGRDSLDLGSIAVVPEYAISDTATIHGARLGPTIELVASEVPQSQATPGETLQISLYWRALDRPEKDYTVFVHLMDPDWRLLTQYDAQPLGGGFPTSTWYPGLSLVDHCSLTLPDDAAAGQYTLLVGMYDLLTGERLPIVNGDGDDSLSIGSITIP